MKQREVRIDHKTVILTSSDKPDEEVRDEYLKKIADSMSSQHKRIWQRIKK